MPPELVALTEGPSILLDKPILLLGRHQECDIQLNSRKVSRRHCCIAQVNDYLVIRDLGSTNGICINGEKVLEGKLNNGDKLTIGNFHFQVKWTSNCNKAVAEGNSSQEEEEEEMHTASSDEEEMGLDSSENPIPLEEPSSSAQFQIQTSEPANSPSNKSGSSSDNRMVDQPPSLILPDNLDLAPSSENLSDSKQ